MFFELRNDVGSIIRIHVFDKFRCNEFGRQYFQKASSVVLVNFDQDVGSFFAIEQQINIFGFINGQIVHNLGNIGRV